MPRGTDYPHAAFDEDIKTVHFKYYHYLPCCPSLERRVRTLGLICCTDTKGEKCTNDDTANEEPITQCDGNVSQVYSKGFIPPLFRLFEAIDL